MQLVTQGSQPLEMQSVLVHKPFISLPRFVCGGTKEKARECNNKLDHLFNQITLRQLNLGSLRQKPCFRKFAVLRHLPNLKPGGPHVMEFIDKMFGFQIRITANADDHVPNLTEFMKSSEFYITILSYFSRIYRFLKRSIMQMHS